jgi:antitoxin component YwqK of YwqJK toxin-antitoxin module
MNSKNSDILSKICLPCKKVVLETAAQKINFYGFVNPRNENFKEGEVYLEDRSTLLYKGTFGEDSYLREGKLYNSDGTVAEIVNNKNRWSYKYVINSSRDARGDGYAELYYDVNLVFKGDFEEGEPKNGRVYKLGDGGVLSGARTLKLLDSESALLKDGKLSGIFTDYFTGEELSEAGFIFTAMSWIPKFEGELRDGEYWTGILYEATLGPPNWIGYRAGKAVIKGYVKDGVESLKEPENFDGQGIEYGESGKKVYEGTFKFSKYYGEGIQYDPDGKKLYEGDFKFGTRDGKGIKYYPNGKKLYEGTFKYGQYDDEGIEYYSNGKKIYEGTYKDNKYSGKGIQYNRDGNKIYEGTYKDNKYSGQGIQYDRDGNKIYEGTFKDGKMYKGIKYDGDRIIAYVKNGVESRERPANFNGGSRR